MNAQHNAAQRDAHVRAALGLPQATFDPTAPYPKAAVTRIGDRLAYALSTHGRARTDGPGWHRLTRAS